MLSQSFFFVTADVGAWSYWTNHSYNRDVKQDGSLRHENKVTEAEEKYMLIVESTMMT
jgi:hypothetical protein